MEGGPRPETPTTANSLLVSSGDLGGPMTTAKTVLAAAVVLPWQQRSCEHHVTKDRWTQELSARQVAQQLKGRQYGTNGYCVE